MSASAIMLLSDPACSFGGSFRAVANRIMEAGVSDTWGSGHFFVGDAVYAYYADEAIAAMHALSDEIRSRGTRGLTYRGVFVNRSMARKIFRSGFTFDDSSWYTYVAASRDPLKASHYAFSPRDSAPYNLHLPMRSINDGIPMLFELIRRYFRRFNSIEDRSSKPVPAEAIRTAWAYNGLLREFIKVFPK